MARETRRRVTLRREAPATWTDLADLPDDVIGEIVAGQIVVTPRPGVPHARSASRLGIVLGGPFDLGAGGPGGWILLDEPHVRFGDDIRVPDLAGWRKERWVDPPRTGPLRIVPDWVCEVLSPSTEGDDRTEKMDTYRRAQVPHVWLLGPIARSLEVYRLEPQGWRLAATAAGDQRVRAEPFDAIELDLSLLWSGLPEPEEE